MDDPRRRAARDKLTRRVMSRPSLTFQRYTSREARAARGPVESVYRGAYT
jgi:hypothetical protein